MLSSRTGRQERFFLLPRLLFFYEFLLQCSVYCKRRRDRSWQSFCLNLILQSFSALSGVKRRGIVGDEGVYYVTICCWNKDHININHSAAVCELDDNNYDDNQVCFEMLG